MRKIWVIAAAVVLAGGAVHADTVSGKIENASPNAINVLVYDNEGRPYPNLLPVKVNRQSIKLEGVDSVTDLMSGDEVRLDVKQNQDGSWQATSIEKADYRRQNFGPDFATTSEGSYRQPVSYARPESAPGLYSTRAQAPNPLMTALTSPRAKKLAKDGLMGAAVGGLAAGTSGGKAGKGALIGAGTGAAAGLIGDLLTQPHPANQAYDANGNPVYADR